MKKVELVEMRKDGEAVYSGPTLPPLSPGERAEVSADMASCFCRFAAEDPENHEPSLFKARVLSRTDCHNYI